MNKIRKENNILQEDDPVKQGYCSKEILDFLKNCIKANVNIIVGGRAGAGKTEFIKYLCQFIPKEDIASIDENVSALSQLYNIMSFHPRMFAIDTCNSRVNAKYFVQCLSHGLTGSTTFQTNDATNILDEIWEDAEMDCEQKWTDVYQSDEVYPLLTVGILIRREMRDDCTIRTINQVVLFKCEKDKNTKTVIVENGKQISDQIPENLMKKFERAGIADPFVFTNEKS